MLRMQVDGKYLRLDAMRWQVYEATRRSEPLAVDAHTLTVTSQLRMAWNDSALLWKISVENRVLEGVPPDAISYQDIIHTLQFSVQAIARQVRFWVGHGINQETTHQEINQSVGWVGWLGWSTY